MGAILAPTRFSSVRISIRDLVADILTEEICGWGGGQNLVLTHTHTRVLVRRSLIFSEDVHELKGFSRKLSKESLVSLFCLLYQQHRTKKKHGSVVLMTFSILAWFRAGQPRNGNDKSASSPNRNVLELNPGRFSKAASESTETEPR